MSIASFDDYAESSNVELLQREKATHSSRRKVFTDHAYCDTVFEQYELDVPCYDNDTSLPELVSATIRPIYEFYQIPGAEQMQRGYNEESPGDHPRRFANNRMPRWQEPEGEYDRAPDQPEEYIHTVYVSRGPGDSGQDDFSPNCVFEEHYVFDVFEKPEEGRKAPPEYQSDSDWTGPIITEVTDSEDEQGSGDEGENAKGAADDKKSTPSAGKTRSSEKLAKGMSTVSNAGVSHIPAAGPANEHVVFSQSPGIVVEEMPRGVRPTGPGLSRLTGLRGTVTGNMYNQELLHEGDDLLWQNRYYRFNDIPNQMLMKSSSVGRKPNLVPHALCNVPMRESVLLTGAFDGVGAIGTPGPMAFTLNESFDPYSLSLLNTPDGHMYSAQEYDAAMSLPYQTNQRQILMAGQMGMGDPYGDGILTAISHHNKLIDQFPPTHPQYFHPRVPYQPEEYTKLYQYAPAVNRRFVAPSFTVTANIDRARRLREQQNRLPGFRRAGLAATQVRHAGMQSQQPSEFIPPQNEFLAARRKEYYRTPNENFFDEVYHAGPRVRVPFDRVNVTVSARPYAGRYVDETTEVLEKLNDIYQYVLTKPAVGQVKTKIEEVHQSVHSRDANDFFSLSSMTDFLDYNVKGGRLRPIHLGPQQRRVIQPAGPNFPASKASPAMGHNVRLINDLQERAHESFFTSRPFQRPLNMRDPRIPRVGLRDVHVECENCFEF